MIQPNNIEYPAGDVDNDKDVDGLDISSFAGNYAGIGLAEFAAVFGKVYQ